MEQTGQPGASRDGPLILAAGSMLDCSTTRLLDAASSAGFDGVGLRLSGVHAVADATEAAGVTRRATDLGLIIHDVEVVRIDADWHDGHPPDEVVRLLESATALGARSVLAVGDLTDRSATVDALHHLVDAAAALDITVGLEYMGWTLPRTPSDALAMANEVGCTVVVDVLHHVRVGAGPDDLDAIVDSGRLGWVQTCDAAHAAAVDLDDVDEVDEVGRNDLIHEARHRRLPPGQGILPIADLIARLPGETAISVEVQSDELLAVEPAARARLLADAAHQPRSTG